MNTIIKSTIILALAAVFFVGSIGVTFAGHNTIIPEGAKVYSNEPAAIVLDDFGAAGTTFADSATGVELNIMEAEESGEWGWR